MDDPDQVPRPNPAFVNRVDELALLDQLVPRRPGVDSQLAVVTGLVGVGKSAMVYTWVARQREHFPDGRLYVDFAALRTPDGTAVGDGLADVLRSLGVAESTIPTSLAARTNLYRSTISTRRCVVMLDDVTEPAHVRPFLPNSGGSVVVATSNGRLVELELDGAMPVELEPLADDDAVELLRRHCGDGRVDADPAASIALARLCSGLPIALRVAVARLLRRPHLPVAALVAELTDDDRRLGGLSVGGRHDSIADLQRAPRRRLPCRLRRPLQRSPTSPVAGTAGT
ncbi:NB-ARC domain-containing protein [Actinocrispum wychmicini]|uniref:NB-ARC domain-containing protein n=1 Tax=Actinocrispum wychmicini TaxID=1213861 RepID=UPI00140488BF|nr:NB-ARC domain-containing protein [Actinocrispum wychmicini]